MDVDETFPPSASPYPSITPWPSISPYPTASATPTASPWPTQSFFPTDSLQPADAAGSVGGRNSDFEIILDNFINGDNNDDTVSEGGDGEADRGGRNEDSSPAPSSILDVMVDRFIQDGIYNRPPPTASPAPSISSFPTLSMFPTLSQNPTVSLFPTESLYPTASPTPTSSPFPTMSLMPTEFVAVPSFEPSYAPSEPPVQKDSASSTVESAGYSQACDDFKEGPGYALEHVVFTYLAESTISSPTFLTEMEMHLLDHAAATALECAPESSFHIYKIGYPEDSVASDATTCEPSHPLSKACWIIQTTMIITTDPGDQLVAKNTVLNDIQGQLNDGSLLTKKFEDISYTQYLGPDPMSNSLPEAPSEGGTSVLIFAVAAVALAVVAVLFFVALIYYTRRKDRDKTHSTVFVDEPSDRSIEITELLSKSRNRLSEHPEHLVSSSSVTRSVDEIRSTRLGRESSARGEGSVSTMSSSRSNGSSANRAPAAKRYYEKARQASKSSVASFPEPKSAESPQRKQRIQSPEDEMSRTLSRSSRSSRSPKQASSRQSSSSKSRSPARSLFVEDPVEAAAERRAFQKSSNSSRASSRSSSVKIKEATIV